MSTRASSEAEASENGEEEEVDADLVEADHDEPAPMHDQSGEVTDERREAAATAKAAAIEQMGEGDFARALEHFTRAIRLAPSAFTYAGRASCFLALKKPYAAIRDCGVALALNTDSPKALKARGKAYRMLGFWEQAHADLTAGQGIDFDDETDGVHRFVAAKIRREKRQRRVQGHTLLYPGAGLDVTEPFRIPTFPVKRLVCVDPVPGRAAGFPWSPPAFYDILDAQAGALGMTTLGRGSADEVWAWEGNERSMAYIRDTRIEELVPGRKHAELIKECDAVVQSNFWLFRDPAITDVITTGTRMEHCLLFEQSSFTKAYIPAEVGIIGEKVNKGIWWHVFGNARYGSAIEERLAYHRGGGAYQYGEAVCSMGSGGRVHDAPVRYPTGPTGWRMRLEPTQDYEQLAEMDWYGGL